MSTRHVLIDEQRYEALKLRAKALRISEDELLRRAIDVALAQPQGAALPDHRQALTEFVAGAREASQSGVGTEPYRFSRDEIYEEREARLARQS